MPSQHNLHVPSNATYTQPQRPGCGCCQHCQCTGRCVGRGATTPESSPSISESPSALLRSGSTKPVALEEGEPGDDHYSALENALHPGDAIPLPRKLSRYVTAQGKHERGPSARRDTSAKVSRDVSPGSKLTSQEEYEAGYSAHPRQQHRRLKGKTEVGLRPNDEERETEEDEEKRHGKERSSKPREERKKLARHVEKDEGDSKEDTSIGDERERQVEEKIQEKDHGSLRSDLSSQSEDRMGKSDLPSHTADFFPSKARPRREIIKEIRALVREATVIPTSGHHSTLASLCSATLTQTDITKGRHVLSSSEDGGSREELSSLRVIRKLTVHAPTEYAFTLHFLDWSRRNERDEPLVAYRLQDGEQGSLERRTATGSLFTRKQGGGRGDWLQESHDTGSKVAGKLTFAVGVKGPTLYHIDVKRRKVDKFTVTSADERDVPFVDDPFFGSYTDHRHLYFATPNGQTMKWHTVERESKESGKRTSKGEKALTFSATRDASADRLMRLYGRAPDNYDIVYAEARMHRGEGRKNRGAKEVKLFFFDPNDPHQPPSKRRSKEQSKGEAAAADPDIAHLCATWWCARQTFDESRLVEAHAEVAFIETIEKAFEVDLLAGA